VGVVSPLGALAGATLTAGLVLAVLGMRGTDQPPAPTGTNLRRRAISVARSLSAVRVAAALAAGGLVLAWTGWPVAAAGAAAATAFTPGLTPRRRQGRGAERMIARLDALAGWTRRLADLLAAGTGGLEHTVAASVHTCPPAIAAEVAALAVEARTRGLEPALLHFADQIDDPVGDRVAASLILRARTGGPGLRPVLDHLAEATSAEVASRREVEAERARPRANARTIAVLTATVTTALLVFARDYLTPFGTPAGQLMLAVITLVFAGALVWMHAIARPRPGPRFLTHPLPRAQPGLLWRWPR
jgi:hypothetical protein